MLTRVRLKPCHVRQALRNQPIITIRPILQHGANVEDTDTRNRVTQNIGKILDDARSRPE